ncbi:MAG: permease-like cell division protein FtsX [Eubacterium sp.]|nr:permease-like cell division protein FtsX [Eubacterium sp.]
MTASSLRYLIKEGLKNTWTNRMMSFASIAVLLCCLVLIGSASMMFLNINSIVERIEDENVIMVFIDDNTTDEQINEMGEKLKAIPNIELVEFVSKEEAWADQLKTMEDAQARFFTEVSSDIPLPDAYKITVDDLTKFSTTVKQIKKLDHIYTIRQNTDLAKKLDTISHGISIIAIIIIAVLFAISLFIISNTIKLTVYSRRLEISIMKSVGATNSFVRLPFVVEGCLIGVISGVASLGVVWLAYDFAIQQFSDLFKAIQIVPLNFIDYAWQMLGIFVAIGIVSGVGGSLITMRRYLNKEGSEISAI